MSADPRKQLSPDDPTLQLAGNGPAESTERSLDDTIGQAKIGAEPPEVPRLASEDQGRYIFQRELGRGSYGTVFLAQDQLLGRTVAVKVLHCHVESPGQEKAVIREAQTLAKMDHPRILPVYDVYRAADGALCVVTKFVDGPSLADVLKTRHMSFVDGARLVAEVAEALQHTHQRGVIHRDVKPSNILLAGDGSPLVTDFGLALVENQQRERRGEVSGSPAYMSPEQVRGKSHHLDGRTDIWSLGVVLYELLTGRRPFQAQQHHELFEEILYREPKPPRMIDANVPGELQQVVLRAIRKDVAQRFASAAEMGADLRAWLDTQPKPAAPVPVTPAPPRRTIVWVVSGIVASAGLAILAVALGLWNRGDVTAQNGSRSSASRRSVNGALSGGAAATTKYRGQVNVRVWSQENPQRKGLWLHETGALPLATDELVRVEAEIDPPGYAYVIWIDSAGKASPVYPWQPGDWNSRPKQEKPVSRVSLPESLDTGWPLEGPAGMETVVLLVRDQPLPPSVDLPALLSGMPAIPLADSRAFLFFDDGQVPVDRGPRFHELRQLDDPLLTTQRILRERLGPHVPFMRSVSFANAGEKK